MASFSTLSKVVSGLFANERALQVTAHNLANVETKGFVRQQVLMSESKYLKVGNSASGAQMLGIGTDIDSIRQVRDQFLDQAYRSENSRMGFYESQTAAVEEIEQIFGELEGESFSAVLNDLWTSINELAKHPEGLETRGAFIQSSIIFMNRSNLAMEQLNNYQLNLNTQVKDMVNRVNELGEQINNLNKTIVKYESSGDNANDYRDQRNELIDELSTYVSISYRDDQYGNTFVKVEGQDFVSLNHVYKLNTEQAAPLSQMISPMWESTGKPLYFLENGVRPENDGDMGKLKGLIFARGTKQANYTDMLNPVTYESDIKTSIVMNIEAQFDQLIHGMVTMINDIVAPNTVGPPPMQDTTNAPYGLNGERHVEVFSRNKLDRYNGLGQYNEEDSTNWYTQYTLGNMDINKEVLDDYDKLCFSVNTYDLGDSSIVYKMIKQWSQPIAALEPGSSSKLDINEYYNSLIATLGNVGGMTQNSRDSQDIMVSQINNQRNSLTGVSSDEELNNMLRFQHAYNASSRVITVVDQMIESLVTRLGLVGR